MSTFHNGGDNTVISRVDHGGSTHSRDYLNYTKLTTTPKLNSRKRNIGEVNL